jgi:hypothetical protein
VVPCEECGPSIDSSANPLQHSAKFVFARFTQDFGQGDPESEMPTHCVLRVIYPVSWMGRVPLQSLQINPQMVASVAA